MVLSKIIFNLLQDNCKSRPHPAKGSPGSEVPRRPPVSGVQQGASRGAREDLGIDVGVDLNIGIDTDRDIDIDTDTGASTDIDIDIDIDVGSCCSWWFASGRTISSGPSICMLTKSGARSPE